jgi:hypothetical protein
MESQVFLPMMTAFRNPADRDRSLDGVLLKSDLTMLRRKMHTWFCCACHALEVGHITPAIEICKVSCRRQLIIVQLQLHTLVSKASCCSFLFHYQLRQPQLWPTADSWRTASSKRRDISNQGKSVLCHKPNNNLTCITRRRSCLESRSQFGEESKTRLQMTCHRKTALAEGSNTVVEKLQDTARRPTVCSPYAVRGSGVRARSRGTRPARTSAHRVTRSGVARNGVV